ncbi:MAG: HhH-GPD-type base excision DNA repair protein [Acidimicrobiia bacterium]|jgi:uncharacterized HhH-GPD family protein
MPVKSPTLAITGDPEADALLVTEPLALVIGMLLDQQVPMEWAFRGPTTLKARLGGRLDANEIAAMPEDEFVAVFSTKPALHRFPGSMGKRTHALCRYLVDEYDGDAAAVWTGAKSGTDLLARVQALPGFGEEKAKIFCAMLAKRFGVKPRGWQQATVPFSDKTPRSVADIDSPEALARVRAWKKAQKAAGKSKQD